MKIRTDFVTNSSSSSFILGFKDKDSMAGDLTSDHTGGELEQILTDCTNSKPMTKEEALELAREEYYWMHEINVLYFEEYNGTDEEKEAEIQRRVDKSVSELEADMEGKNVFVEVEYSDNDGERFSNLEHYIMPNLNCCLVRFSHH